MNKFYNTSPEEQETIINILHGEKEARCYTSRYATYNRLKAKLGEPTKTYYIQKQISGAYWDIPISDKKRMNVIFSKTTIIGNVK